MRSARTLLLVLTLVGGCHLALDFEGLEYTGEGGSSGVAGSGASTAGAGGVTTSNGTGGDGGNGAGGGHTGGGGQPPSDCPDGKVEVPPDPPAGWQGLVSIARGPDDGALPACGGAITLHGDLYFNDAVCSCQCATPVASHCTAQIEHFDSTCASAQGTIALTNLTCNTTDVAHAKWTAITSSAVCGGSVQSSTSPPGWAEHLRICGFTVTNIDPPGCTDAPPGPFEPRLCIHRAGSHTCPAGYPLAWNFYGSHDDSRGCQASCTCGPAGTVCTGTVTAFQGGTCNLNEGYPPQGSCVDFGAFSTRYAAQLGGGSCTPTSSPQPTGTVTPSSPTTICCAQ